MERRKFDPNSPEYKTIEDLPPEFKSDFVNIEAEGSKKEGFVSKDAAEKFEEAAVLASLEDSHQKAVDVLHAEALNENEEMDGKLYSIKSPADIRALVRANEELRRGKLALMNRIGELEWENTQLKGFVGEVAKIFDEREKRLKGKN